MTAFNRLSRFGSTVKERALPIWKSARCQFERGLRWLKLRPRVVPWAGGVSIAAILLIGFLIGGGASWYDKHHDAIAPLLTLVAGISVAAVALVRHFAQTDADRQRRITESFSKAVEQLGSDKLEVRLGGIYSLERISKESPDDYWTVMEILTALVRVRAHWEKPDANTVVSEGEKSTPPLLRLADIASIMTVLMRRKGLKREVEEGWQLDLKGVDLRGWVPSKVHLAGADLTGANLSGIGFPSSADLTEVFLTEAILTDAFLIGVNLSNAYLFDTNLTNAFLTEADLTGADFAGAILTNANLIAANLAETNLDGADLAGAHFERADLWGATIYQKQLDQAYGNAATRLPAGLARPTHWLSPAATGSVPPDPNTGGPPNA